jgi:hypothetical protein
LVRPATSPEIDAAVAARTDREDASIIP